MMKNLNREYAVLGFSGVYREITARQSNDAQNYTDERYAAGWGACANRHAPSEIDPPGLDASLSHGMVSGALSA
jgi:hypothetical protein